MEKKLQQLGYAKSSNNIHSLPGEEWYASKPGIPELKAGFNSVELRLVNNKLQIWQTKYYQKPDNSGMFTISGVAKNLKNIKEFIKMCTQISQSALSSDVWGK